MMRRRLFKCFAILSALLVLTVVIVSRIPTAGCHCFNPHKAAQRECPFGKLRGLAASIVLEARLVVEAALEPRWEHASLTAACASFCSPIETRRARDPPFTA